MKKNECATIAIARVLTVLAVVLSAHAPSEAAEQPSMDAKHARTLEIEGRDWPADQNNYPVSVCIRKGEGRDENGNIFAGSAVRDDFADVRFRLPDGQELPHWQESRVDGKQAFFWVRVPQIPRNGKTGVVLHHGNPLASSASDGKKTFHFFDDFCGDYEGFHNCGSKKTERAPPDWELSFSDADCNWRIKDGLLHFRGSGHLTTRTKVWPAPADQTYTLRARVKWPDPAFANEGENGESFGAVSWNQTDGNAWMNIFALYQTQLGSKLAASFGSMPHSKPEEQGPAYIQSNAMKFEMKAFEKAEKGKFYTFEIERNTGDTADRILEINEEIRSKNVIPGETHLMIHGCHFGYPTSPYLTLDWMLLRKHVFPPPLVRARAEP